LFLDTRTQPDVVAEDSQLGGASKRGSRSVLKQYSAAVHVAHPVRLQLSGNPGGEERAAWPPEPTASSVGEVPRDSQESAPEGRRDQHPDQLVGAA
jgi:hypothetical protein